LNSAGFWRSPRCAFGAASAHLTPDLLRNCAAGLAETDAGWGRGSPPDREAAPIVLDDASIVYKHFALFGDPLMVNWVASQVFHQHNPVYGRTSVITNATSERLMKINSI
jgi:hypothetical protein